MATVRMRNGADLTNRTLVTGAAGILGSALLRSERFAGALGTVHQTPAAAAETVALDLRDPHATRRALDEAAPAVIVHTVSLTDVDASEQRPADAHAVSALTTLNLATWAAQRSPGTLLVYISSDQVYSGEGPHTEDTVRPVNAYGAAKHAGELAAAAAPRSLVLRTNFYGRSHGARPSFTDWIAGSVRRGTSIQLDEEARFSPLHLSELVDLVADAAERGLEGVFNAGASDWMDKLSFGRAVAVLAAAGGDRLVSARGLVDDVRAPRPLDLRLDTSRLAGTLGAPLPAMADGLAVLAAELADG
jgi:dTDP-4-dehydrorhamnose reductase